MGGPAGPMQGLMGTLRLLLALAVVIAHTDPLLGMGWTKLTGGVMAVQLFYMISGFYMALILTEKYTGPGSLKTFYSNRLIRLFPAYWAVTLAIAVIGVGLIATTGQGTSVVQRLVNYSDQFSVWTWVALAFSHVFIVGQDWLFFCGIDLVSNAPGLASAAGSAGGELYFIRSYNDTATPASQFLLDSPAWTIGVELTFYAFAPWLVKLSNRSLALVAAASLGARVFAIHGLDLTSSSWQYRFFPFELVLFLAGIMAYRIYRHGRERRWWQDGAGRWMAGGLWVGSVAGVLGWKLLPAWGVSGWVASVVGLPPVYLLFALSIPAIFTLTARWGWDRTIGDLSYPLYIGHMAVIQLVARFDGVFDPFYRSVWVTALSLGLAVALYWGLDRPVDRWRQRRVAAAKARRREAEADAAADRLRYPALAQTTGGGSREAA